MASLPLRPDAGGTSVESNVLHAFTAAAVDAASASNGAASAQTEWVGGLMPHLETWTKVLPGRKRFATCIVSRPFLRDFNASGRTAAAASNPIDDDEGRALIVSFNIGELEQLLSAIPYNF